ncbi:MAG: sugar ABC transporter ATP-binding protein [Propionivibrio sp.]
MGLDDVSPSQLVQGLGMAQRQLIEIAKALSGDSRIVIMDEPTATLTSRETQRLFEIIARLRDAGVAILFVSHHLQELFEICDSVTVLRNGSKVSTQAIGETTPHDLVRLMVGREVVEATPRANVAAGGGQDALRVAGLRFKGQPRGARIDFAVGRGEILGVAGLVGSGRTETVRAIFGADPLLAGEIYREDRLVKIRSPADALAEGICLVTEDRKDEGLLLDMPIRANLSLARLDDCSRAGWLLASVEAADAERMAKTLQIRLTTIEQHPRQLSGGNQQKVVLGKWLLCEPAVLMLDEPTRGVDVGAKAEIHRLLQAIADAGKALIVVSSDLPELMQLTDRIIVLSKGKIAGEVARKDFDESRILELAYSEYMKSGEGNAEAA